MNLTEKQLESILKNGHVKINKGNISSRVANMEPSFGNKQVATKKDPRFDRQVNIIIRSYRHRECDPFGVSEKYIIDSIVDRGILQDDSKKQICEKTSYHEQIKIPKSEPERTEIEIKEV